MIPEFHGNVRELRNILQRAVMLAGHEETTLRRAHVTEALGLLSHVGADAAEDGLRCLWEWAVSNQHRFWNRHRQVNRPPPEGWAGRWDIRRMHKGPDAPIRTSPEDDCWDQICLTTGVVSKLLDEAGFDKKAVIQDWVGREWTGGTGNSTTTCRIDSETTRVHCFRREVMERHCMW